MGKTLKKILLTGLAVLSLGYGVYAKSDVDFKINAGVKIGTDYFSAGINSELNLNYGDFTVSGGCGFTYHSNYCELEKSGIETRLSGKIGYDNDKFGVSVGINSFGGFGELEEFCQRTGICEIKFGDFSVAYENDGYPYYKLGLTDASDSFRSAAAKIKYDKYSLDLKLFTGKRDLETTFPKREDTIVDEKTGKFGEKYRYQITNEESYPYRYGCLSFTINDAIQNYDLTFGVNSERLRHIIQNRIIHQLRKNPEFVMTNDDAKLIFDVNSLENNFSLW